MYQPSEDELHFRYYVFIAGYTIYALILILYFVWIIKVAFSTRQSLRDLRNCQRSNDIDQNIQRVKIYNCKTCIGRNILLIAVGLSEIGYSLSLNVSSLIEYIADNNGTFGLVHHLSPNCTTSNWLNYSYEHQYMLVWYGTSFIGIILFLNLLSVLTRYLKNRYLEFSVKRIYLKFAIWFTIQSIIIFLCSTLYTFLLLFIIGPIIVLINLLVLIADSRDFSRFLIFHNRGLYFQFKDEKHYKSQMNIHRWYKISISFILTAQFFGVIALFLINYVSFLEIIFFSSCSLEKIYGININFNSNIEWISVILSILRFYLNPLATIVFVILSGIPIFLISGVTFWKYCYTLCITQRTPDYTRFNYQKMESLIRKQ